jgi:hypothetical protein
LSANGRTIVSYAPASLSWGGEIGGKGLRYDGQLIAEIVDVPPGPASLTLVISDVPVMASAAPPPKPEGRPIGALTMLAPPREKVVVG